MTSQTPLLLTFQQLQETSNSQSLQKWNQQDVVIRGFLYAHDDGWILAAEPNLKTCCVGNPQNISRQISLDLKDNSHNENAVVVATGYFIIQPFTNSLGETTQLYKLQNTHIEPVPHFSYAMLLLPIVGMILWITIRQYMRRHNDA